ncbi:hypothetical protein PIB30_062681, partial [Stylosanthes scabra]|nr:hypothetical protein [Stylosanthes scabra]
TFYDGTLPTSRILLDSAANGSLRTKTPEEALELIELVANNQYMNFSERSTMKKGVLEVDSVNVLMAQLSAMNKNFMDETRANFRNQEAAIRNLEIQVGQIAKQLNERPPNTFPSDTIPNPKE